MKKLFDTGFKNVYIGLVRRAKGKKPAGTCHAHTRREVTMKFELIAQMIDGAREELSQPEFIGDGIETIDDAISAAKKALEYLNGEQLIARYIDIYCDGNIAVSNGYCGYVDDAGWHRDCDCDLG